MKEYVISKDITVFVGDNTAKRIDRKVAADKAWAKSVISGEGGQIDDYCYALYLARAILHPSEFDFALADAIAGETGYKPW